MLIVNAGSILLFSVTRFSKYYLPNTSTGGIVAQQAWYVYYCYNNCIKLSAVSGCLLILSASVITEEPYNRVVQSNRTFVLTYNRIVPSCYPSYLVLSFASCFRLCIHSFIANRACASARRSAAGCAIIYSNRVNRRCSWRLGQRRYFV